MRAESAPEVQRSVAAADVAVTPRAELPIAPEALAPAVQRSVEETAAAAAPQPFAPAAPVISAPDVQRSIAEPRAVMSPRPIGPAQSARDPIRRMSAPGGAIAQARDPRLLARRRAPASPPAALWMALSARRPLAVLPQAHATPSATVQRMPVATSLAPQVGAVRPPTVTPQSADAVQRAAETRQSVRSARRTEQGKRQRAALPLVKALAKTRPATVQRQTEDDERRENFIGASEASGPQSVSGPDQSARRRSSSAAEPVSESSLPLSSYTPPDTETEPGEGPDLDLLARAILPLVKRMMALERERRSAW
jgi:hypothetical protein